MTPSDHARLLLAILARDWERAEALARSGPVDRDGFVGACCEADVPTWILRQLVEAGREALVGAEAVAGLCEVRNRVRRDNLLLLAHAYDALDHLLEAGVVPVALKGLDFLHRLYERFDDRTMDDVDLLIRSQDLRAALDALRRGGWRLPPEPLATRYIRSSHHLPLKGPGSVPIELELHWNLAQTMRYRIEGDALVARALPLEVEGRRVLRLDDHDLVAHLALHHFTHYFDRRLKWAVDLRQVAAGPGFRWDEVGRRLREWGAAAAAGSSIRHLHKLVPQWVPSESEVGLPLAAWRRLAVLPLRSSHPLELFRRTRSRRVQLYLAAVHLERPWQLPRWLIHRAVRTRHPGEHPLDSGTGGG